MLWYFTLYVLLAGWVLWDAHERRNHRIGWPVGTALLGPIMLPFYLAHRHLGPGESREGGRGWNVTKYFALFWTATMGVAGVAGMMSAGQVAAEADSEAARAGAAFGTMLGLGVLFGLWLVVMIAALVLGLFLKTSTVEEGPTGALKAAADAGDEVSRPVGAPRWAAFAVGTVAILAALVMASVPQSPHSQTAYYMDLETNELFVAGRHELPPIHAPSGGQGVAARLYTCGGCNSREWFGYLKTYDPEAKRRYEASGDLPAEADQFIRRLEGGGWVPGSSSEARAMRNEIDAACGDHRSPQRCLP